MGIPTTDTQNRRRGVGRWRRWLRNAVRYVPQEDSIPGESWQARHRNVLVLLVTYAPLLYSPGDLTGSEPYITGATLAVTPAEHILLGVGVVVESTLFAWLPWPPRRIRSGFASIGLLTCSALLVYFSGGYIKTHLHFFVIVVVLTIYEDWFPFAVGALYAAIQHDVFDMDHPETVYNHSDTITNPMDWRLVHMVFVLMLASAPVMSWFSVECSHGETRQKMQSLEDNEETKAEVEHLNEQSMVQADEFVVAMDAVSEEDFAVNSPEGSDIEVTEAISDAFTAMKRGLSSIIVDFRVFAATVE